MTHQVVHRGVHLMFFVAVKMLPVPGWRLLYPLVSKGRWICPEGGR